MVLYFDHTRGSEKTAKNRLLNGPVFRPLAVFLAPFQYEKIPENRYFSPSLESPSRQSLFQRRLY
jgi:hypothetical protein